MKSNSVARYKGVTQNKRGKFNAEIGNKKKGSRVWLGTFSTAIEAAKAYDQAAIQLYGTTATLNFPTHIPVQESNDTVPVTRKRKPVPRKRKLPSRYASEVPKFKKLQKRQPSKESQEACDCLYEDVLADRVNSVASSEDVNKSNDVPCANLKNVVADEVDSVVADSVEANNSNQVPHVNLKDCMVPSVDPNKSNQVARENFKNVVASSVDCMAPSVDPKKSNQVVYVILESDDEDVGNYKSLDVPVQHTLLSSQFGNMETEEATSVSKNINETRQEDQCVGDGDGSKQSQKMAKRDTKPKPSSSDSNRAAGVKEVMTGQNAAQRSVVNSVNQVGKSSIGACISVLNRMVDAGLMAARCDLWRFAVNMFKDDVYRELFASLPDDFGRRAWLQYLRNPANQTFLLM